MHSFILHSQKVKLKYITDCKCRILKTGVYRSVLASFSNGYLCTATRLLGLLLNITSLITLLQLKRICKVLLHGTVGQFTYTVEFTLK